MKIVIHARHADLAADFRKIAEEKLRSMDRFSVTIERVEVEILHEQNPRQGKRLSQSHEWLPTNPFGRSGKSTGNSAYDNAIYGTTAC